MWLIIIILFIIGIIGTVSPRSSWYLSNWWKFQGNVEPNERTLIIYRIQGIIFIIVAIIIVLSELN